jgi:hypothetical protein
MRRTMPNEHGHCKTSHWHCFFKINQPTPSFYSILKLACPDALSKTNWRYTMRL